MPCLNSKSIEFDFKGPFHPLKQCARLYSHPHRHRVPSCHLSPSFRCSIRTSTQEQPYLILSIKAGYQTLSISIRSAFKEFKRPGTYPLDLADRSEPSHVTKPIKIDSKRY